MKVLAVNGSPHPEGNTHLLLQTVLTELTAAGIETEEVHLPGPVSGCRACGACRKMQNGTCVIADDPINGIIAKMISADGILLGSPTYFANVTTEMKALIDRAGFVALANDSLFRRKLGAAVIAVRRAGSIQVFNAINEFFLINQMIVVGSRYWNLGIGLQPGDVLRDEEGMDTMRTLGKNMAWALQKLHG